MNLAYGETEEMLRESFASFFAAECPSQAVREAEPLGFCPSLWKRFAETGAPAMRVPVDAGGADAGLGEAILVAEAAGAALAPLPFSEVAAATRLLASSGADAAEPDAIVTLLLKDCREPQLVPAGAVATKLVGLEGDALVLREGSTAALAHAANLGACPIARWDADDADRHAGTVLARGDAARSAFGAALAEWRLLTAAALVGLAHSALELGTEYARTREQFGVAIGSFQAISHPLADASTRVDGARLLVQEAAWAQLATPSRFSELASMALFFASETATHISATSLHVHGGYGFSLEYDIQLHYRRAAAWSALAGGPRAQLRDIAALRLDRTPSREGGA